MLDTVSVLRNSVIHHDPRNWFSLLLLFRSVDAVGLDVDCQAVDVRFNTNVIELPEMIGV